MKILTAVLFAAVLVCLPTQASGQGAFVRLQTDVVTDTISSNGDSVVMTVHDIGSFGTVKVQTLDSYSGTWEVQCAADGTNYDTAAELKMNAADSSTVVTSVTDSVGIWDVQNAAGCRAIRVISTAGFAASDVAVVVSATLTGGAGGGGGGAGGGGDATNAEQVTQTTHLAAIETATEATQTATEATATALDSFAPACNASAAIHVSSSGNTELVPLSSGKVIDVCSVTLITDGTVDVQFIQGTGSACATNETDLTGTMGLGIAGTAPPGFSGRGLHTPVSTAFCIELSGAVAVEGWIEYVQYTP